MQSALALGGTGFIIILSYYGAMMHAYVASLQDSDQLSANSKKTYITLLARIKQALGDRDWEYIVSHPNVVYRRLKKVYSNINTLRSCMAALKALFKHNDSLKQSLADAASTYHDLFSALDEQIQDRMRSGKPTLREEKNWVPWNEVLQKEKDLAASEFGSTRHLLLAFYCLINPARQDYGNVELLTKVPGTAHQLTKANYIVFDSSSRATLVVNEYKTAKFYGCRKTELTPQLVSIIKASLQAVPRRYLFQDSYGRPYTNRSSFSRFSNAILADLFAPRRATINTLRHSFISGLDYNASSPGELFDHARSMGHSIAQQQLYRKKVTDYKPPHQQQQHMPDGPDDFNDFKVVLVRDTPLPPPPPPPPPRQPPRWTCPP